MADTDSPTATITYADAPATPPADTVAPPAPPDVDDEPFDKARAMALIEKLRGEVKDAKAGSRETDDLRRRLKEHEDAQLSEQDRLAKRADEAEAKVAEANRRLEAANLIAELSKPEHGIVNASAAAKLIDGVTYGDDGQPNNLDDVLPGFLDSNAFLRGAQAAPPAPNLNAGGGQASTTPPSLTADELQAATTMGMSAQEYHAFKGAKNLNDLTAAAQQATASTP